MGIAAIPHPTAQANRIMNSPARTALRIPGSPAFWIVLGLALKLPGMETGPRSQLWYMDVPLYVALIIGLIAQYRGWPGLQLNTRSAAIAFIIISVACGMIYESSLTVDGTGVGGMHPNTRTSFVLAIGDYLLLAVLCWLVVRLLHLDFRGLFFLSAGISLTEGLVFTGVIWAVLASPGAWQVPIYLAYYFLAYATFLGIPLLIINPAALWRASAPVMRIGPLMLMVTGFVIGMGARIVWGLLYGPAATKLFDLQPAVD